MSGMYHGQGMIYHGNGIACPSGRQHALSLPCGPYTEPSGAAYVPDPPKPPEEVPQWFIDWRASQYNADLLDLVDRLQSVKAAGVDSATRAHTRMADLERKLSWFKMRKSAKRAVKAERRGY